jgi:hypothetical protein
MNPLSHFDIGPSQNVNATASSPQLEADSALSNADTIKASETKVVSISTANNLGDIDAGDASPIRVTFTIQYTELGMDRLYGELAALRTAPERVRHIKRCLHDIVRGDFKRPDARRAEFGESDRESFYLAIRLSSRDVGLEPIFNELSPIRTAFKRNNVVRQKLFDAFNSHLGSAKATAMSDVLPLPAAATNATATDSASAPHHPSLTPPRAQQGSVLPSRQLNQDDISQRRQAARRASANQFEKL